MLGVALVGTGNADTALRDFGKRLIAWDVAMQDWDPQVAAAKGTDLVLPRPPALPNIYCEPRLKTDSNLRNDAFARAYGLSSVRLESDLEHALRQARQADTRQGRPVH